ncbi:HGGxSTG domain-containing protein [Planctomycetota bacterium]
MKNGRCRMHGGKSTGPRTPEGLERSRKANWKHGRYSAKSIAARREMREFLSQCRKTIEQVEGAV